MFVCMHVYVYVCIYVYLCMCVCCFECLLKFDNDSIPYIMEVFFILIILYEYNYVF